MISAISVNVVVVVFPVMAVVVVKVMTLQLCKGNFSSFL
jgi:hypothetical protein